jgi:uracil-DNA glycosylase family 4
VRPARKSSNLIGEAPGADEDTQGNGFVGRAGRTLHKLLEEHGLRRGYEYGCANIVRCRNQSAADHQGSTAAGQRKQSSALPSI